MATTRVCNTCKQELDCEKCFVKGNRRCRACYNKIRNEQHKLNPEHKKEINRIYQQTSEKRKAYKLEYQRSEKYRKYWREYVANRYRTDVPYKIRSILSRNVRQGVKAKKDSSTLDVLGCDIQFFMQWLEYNFDQNMSFENHGSYWDIDHVIPCKSFDFNKKEDIEKCFHWSNMVPLEHKENIKKSDKIDAKTIAYYKARVDIFEVENKFRQMCKSSVASNTKLDEKLSNGSEKQTEVW